MHPYLLFNEWKRGGEPNGPIHLLLIAKHEKTSTTARWQQSTMRRDKRYSMPNLKTLNYSTGLKANKEATLPAVLQTLCLCGGV